MLYLPEVKNHDQNNDGRSQSAKSSLTPYSKFFQSAIRSNLKEIQQEEEIIFFEPVKKFEGDQPRMSLKENDITFNEFQLHRVDVHSSSKPSSSLQSPAKD